MPEHTKITTVDIRNAKGAEKPIVCLTAYTTPMAKMLDPHVDLMLIGDSIGMVMYGMENTLGVDLDMMIRHGQAVMRADPKACIVVDMPFGTYEESPEQAYRNAARIMKETGCDAVKLEGGLDMAKTIAHLTSNNIPVMAHIGLQPQSVIKDGGYKVKGRKADEEEKLMADALAVQDAGAFAVVIEGTVEDLSATLSKTLNIPTIGIGASKDCDGQILVTEDMIGLSVGHVPKFVKQYTHLSEIIDEAVSNYATEVRARDFPTQDHVYTRPKLVSDKTKLYGSNS